MVRLWNSKQALIYSFKFLVVAAVLVAIATSSSKLTASDQDDPGDTAISTAAGTPNTSLDEAIKRVIAVANRGDYEYAISQVELLQEKYPEVDRLPAILVQLMGARSRQLINANNRREADKLIFRAVGIARDVLATVDDDKADRLKPLFATTIYERARSLAVAGRKHEAIASLAEALDWGLENIERAMTEPDFVSVAAEPEFLAIVDKRKFAEYEKLRGQTLVELGAFTPFDFDFQLNTIGRDSDEPLTLSQFKGKIVIVDFWGTWCPPCRAEIPSFVKLKEKYGEQGLEVVGLTYSQDGAAPESVESIVQVMQELGVNYPCAIGTDIVKRQLPQFPGYPTTMFIDRTGTVRMVIAGLHPHEKLESIVQALMDE